MPGTTCYRLHLGRAQAPASQRIFKQFAREVNAVLPKLEATRPLRWSKSAITFSSADQLKCAATAGALPMICSPVISNVQVTKTLIDGGAGLNVVGVLGTGVPRLACLWPTAWISQQAVRPIFINKASKTLARGQASRGRRRKTSSGVA